jgi:hypothetical protein
MSPPAEPLFSQDIFVYRAPHQPHLWRARRKNQSTWAKVGILTSFYARTNDRI